MSNLSCQILKLLTLKLTFERSQFWFATINISNCNWMFPFEDSFSSEFSFSFMSMGRRICLEKEIKRSILISVSYRLMLFWFLFKIYFIEDHFNKFKLCFSLLIGNTIWNFSELLTIKNISMFNIHFAFPNCYDLITTGFIFF